MAVEERVKHRQFVPDHVLFTVPTQPHQWIIAIGRDVPAYAKAKIMEQVRALWSYCCTPTTLHT